MKIVVTGALGHIGSALIRMLPDRFPGAEIVSRPVASAISLLKAPAAARGKSVGSESPLDL